eukprot:jgi/Bigna1/88896/estExt_fgenesh1_pg.C_400029
MADDDVSDFERVRRSKVVIAARDAGARAGATVAVGLLAGHALLEYGGNTIVFMTAPKMGITWYSNIKNWRLKLMVGTMGVIASGYYSGEQALYDQLRAEGKQRQREGRELRRKYRKACMFYIPARDAP